MCIFRIWAYDPEQPGGNKQIMNELYFYANPGERVFKKYAYNPSYGVNAQCLESIETGRWKQLPSAFPGATLGYRVLEAKLPPNSTGLVDPWGAPISKFIYAMGCVSKTQLVLTGAKSLTRFGSRSRVKTGLTAFSSHPRLSMGSTILAKTQRIHP